MSERLVKPFLSAPIKTIPGQTGLTAGDAVVLGKLLGAIPEPVLVVGADDRIVEVNPPAKALFPALRLGVPLASHMRSPDVLDAIATARSDGRKTHASWLERVPVERLFEVNVTPIEDLDCGPVTIVYLHEISEARRFERMRVDFITNASHELRTPLASLLGFVETLQGPARADEKARDRFLAIMHQQAQRMSRLVDDLLSLSRIEQHLHLRPKAAVDLNLVLRHIADTLAPLAHETDVDLILDLTEPVIVSGDRDELMRIAENLIENAIKYGASDATDRRVVITVRRERAEGIMSVTDQGPGIAAEHLPRLTERFYRVDAGASRAKGGTGLGLALVKHIVARHRGRLAIESKPDVATTFKVHLPLHPTQGRSVS
jgi:two-component system phosphate regulon sensor histidine kinase PhoR